MEFLGLEYYKDSPIDSKTKQNTSTVTKKIVGYLALQLTLYLIITAEWIYNFYLNRYQSVKLIR